MDIPYSEQVERAALGTMIVRRDALEYAVDTLGLDDFHVAFHRRVFEALAGSYFEGAPVDPTLIAERIGCTAFDVTRLIDHDSARVAPPHHASVLAELGALRRTLGLADQLRQAVDDRDVATIDRLLADPMRSVMPSFMEHPTAPTDVATLAAEAQRFPDMLIAGLQARQEVSMWVGEPGHGKSTLLRQVGVMTACGIHPFTLNPMNALRVLIVDCQESRAQAGREFRRLLAIAGPRYRSGCFAEPIPQGIDISDPRWQRWLDRRIADTGADLVIMGPLYNTVRGASGRSKHSEETAELAMNALNEIMVARNVGIMVEAHAPHGDEMRVRGSKLWEDWPDFGFGLISASTVPRRLTVQRFRGDRHADRFWPNQYVQGDEGDWPWVGVR
jgi:hypothetical protein